MKDLTKYQPLEKKYFEIDINGSTKKVPGIDKAWTDIKKRSFARYMSHPVPVNGTFEIGDKETWLELTRFVIDDLEWLLQQRHHVFWSHMIFSKDAQQLLVTFLQEAPPHYLRSEFPKDQEMEAALEKMERLIFLVFVRLSTSRESDAHYIEDLGSLLYHNYLFTVPILLDICLVYGVQNRRLVAKMFDDVIKSTPMYSCDFEEVVPHFIQVLLTVKDKFDGSEFPASVTKKSHNAEVRDLILHLYDTAANIQIFLDIYSDGSRLFRTDAFTYEVTTFYSSVIPKIYKYIKKSNCDDLRNCCDMLNDIRLNLLSIVRNVFCGIVNDVLNDDQLKEDHANEYLTKMMNILQEPIFLTDYNSIHPIDTDLKLLKDMCPGVDSENFDYISSAIAPLDEVPASPKRDVAGVELDSLVTQVKDILPHLGDRYVEACLRYYNFNAESVIAAVLEDNLPPDIEATTNREPPRRNTVPPAPKKTRNEEMLAVMNDKTELREIREKFSHLTLIPDDDYEDEYDDTYDDRDVRGVDEDQERRPFVTPRILAPRGASEEDDEDEAEEQKPEESSSGRNPDHFVPNPAEIRAKQEQRRMERAKRDYVGRGKGHGQDKQVVMNRDFKGTHKSFMANHNRRKMASRKRNFPIANS